MIAARLPWDASIAAMGLESWNPGCSGAERLIKLPANSQLLRCVSDLTADATVTGDERGTVGKLCLQFLSDLSTNALALGEF